MKIGVLGAGQLGRMLALSAYPLGHQMRFLALSEEDPSSLLGKTFIHGDLLSVQLQASEDIKRAFNSVFSLHTCFINDRHEHMRKWPKCINRRDILVPAGLVQCFEQEALHGVHFESHLDVLVVWLVRYWCPFQICNGTSIQ